MMQCCKIQPTFFPERGEERKQINILFLKYVTDPEIFMPKLCCFCPLKKELRIFTTQNIPWSFLIFLEFNLSEEK